MSDRKKAYIIAEVIFFFIFIITIPAVLSLLLADLKAAVLMKDGDAAFSISAGWGEMSLPLIFIAIGSVLPLIRWLRGFYYPEGKIELPLTVIRVFSLILIVPSLIVLNLLFNSHLRITEKGIIHNRVFLETIILPWPDMKSAKLGLARKTISVGKYGSKEIAGLSLEVSFPGYQMELFNNNIEWNGSAPYPKPIIEVIARHSPVGISLVPAGKDETGLFTELPDSFQKDIRTILTYAQAVVLEGNKRNIPRR